MHLPVSINGHLPIAQLTQLLAASKTAVIVNGRQTTVYIVQADDELELEAKLDAEATAAAAMLNVPLEGLTMALSDLRRDGRTVYRYVAVTT